MVLVIKNLPADSGDIRDAGSITGSGRSPGGGILAWRITWTEEPGGLQSIGSQRVGDDRSDLAHMHHPRGVYKSGFLYKCLGAGFLGVFQSEIKITLPFSTEFVLYRSPMCLLLQG